MLDQTTLDFLENVYQPEDWVEFRTKKNGDNFAKSVYFKAKDVHRIETALGVYDFNKEHVWVGACPRPNVGSKHPEIGRVLWCDLAEGVDIQQTLDLCPQVGLPAPTFYVESGNGYHLYWKLDQAYGVEVIKPLLRYIHDKLPTDATMDPTRVMRLPGTRNYKNPESPKDTGIVFYSAQNYEASVFPSASEQAPVSVQTTPRTPLAPEDRAILVGSFYETQQHTLSLAILGYLRKDLRYSKDEALAEILSIAHEAGNTLEDKRWVANTETTYARPIALIKGSSGLYEHGISLTNTVVPAFTIIKPKPPKIPLINFNDDIAEQELWWDGFVGKGMFSLWAGAPKVGKSFAAMQLAYALATGGMAFDKPVDRPHSVLYFQGELTANMVVQRAKTLWPRLPDARDLLVTGKPSKVINLVENPSVLMDLAERYEVIIVDPISIFHNNDENSARNVTSLIGLFDPLIEQGKSVVIVHHTRKVDGNTRVDNDSIRGSNAWFARPDAIALQVPHGEEGLVRVKFTFRAAPPREDLILYPLPTGGFTPNRGDYLSHHQTLGMRDLN